ncbi:hypothetical protein NDA13_003924 [Ustilago tritici]|nr:hypothetical protein NDA13_003924 [Ustilago tritici]
MIPRSDRVFFNNIEGSPSAFTKPPPPTPVKNVAAQDMQSLLPPSTNTRYVGKRFSVTKDPRKARAIAPATPWRPRISRKPSITSAAPGEDLVEEPSPLDRKLPTNIVPLKLGSKTEPSALSCASTSATLAPTAGEKEEEQGADTCRRESEKVEPGAPKIEQREDRWGLLRSDLANTRTPMQYEKVAHPHPFMTRAQVALPYNPGMAHTEPPSHPFSKRTEPCLAMDMNNDTNIYVNGLPKEMNDKLLYLLGSACGVVISHKAMMDRQTGFCKGFGFLMYASSDMAKKAIDWLNSHGFSSSFAKESFTARLRRMADTTSSNVYLSNLPLKITVDQLEQLFNPHPVASLKILYDVHGESKGVGFVRLHDRATAKLCIDRLHGRVLPGTTLPLQARFADSEAQKQLKHSVSQKQTLESLGLLHLSESMPAPRVGEVGAGFGEQKQQPRSETSCMPASAFGGGSRIRTASELDAAVARGWHARQVAALAHPTPPFPQPFIPGSATSSMQAVRSSVITPELIQGQNMETRTGLGIMVPGQFLWSHVQQPAQVMDAMAWSSMQAPGAMYSGMEGSYPLDRPFVSSADAGVWDGGKGEGGDGAAYLPFPLVPPPGLVYSNPVDRNKAAEDARSRRKNKHMAAAVRVRLAGAADEGKRAVSDPMAMLTAQARLRETQGLPDRVRAAVSADNSIDADVGDASAVADSSDSSEEEEDGVSIDIQVHAQP